MEELWTKHDHIVLDKYPLTFSILISRRINRLSSVRRHESTDSSIPFNPDLDTAKLLIQKTKPHSFENNKDSQKPDIEPICKPLDTLLADKALNSRAQNYVIESTDVRGWFFYHQKPIVGRKPIVNDPDLIEEEIDPTRECASLIYHRNYEITCPDFDMKERINNKVKKRSRSTTKLGAPEIQIFKSNESKDSEIKYMQIENYEVQEKLVENIRYLTGNINLNSPISKSGIFPLKEELQGDKGI